MPERIGLLTGGGDCPGLNAVLRAVVRRGVGAYGYGFIGFRDGWRGPLESDAVELTVESTSRILAVGGTVLGSSRTNPYAVDGGVERLRQNLNDLRVDALVAIGGDDTLGVAARLHDDGVRVVGVPKTIDNDLSGTDSTVGFDTAVAIATEAIDRVRTTADSHRRCLVVEVMGREAGWVALHAGLAGGADLVLIPERPFEVAEVVDHVRRACRDRRGCVVVIAEGATSGSRTDDSAAGPADAFGHPRLGGVGAWLTEEIQQHSGIEARCVVLGHTQRGGIPTAHDRILATRFGLAAADALHAGHFGQMVTLTGTTTTLVPLTTAVAAKKMVPDSRYDEARNFFA
jgi:phosphofructokinase-like protein